MNRDKFITYCKNYLAPKKIVDEYFQEETEPKEDYTSEDADKVYKKYIDYLTTVKEAKSNPKCTKPAGGGRCTSISYHWHNWDDDAWG